MDLIFVEVRNRFNELDLIDREHDELWVEVRDIVQETGIKTIPMDKKCKKANHDSFYKKLKTSMHFCFILFFNMHVEKHAFLKSMFWKYMLIR